VSRASNDSAQTEPYNQSNEVQHQPTEDLKRENFSTATTMQRLSLSLEANFKKRAMHAELTRASLKLSSFREQPNLVQKLQITSSLLD
jgi:hypothetical protein